MEFRFPSEITAGSVATAMICPAQKIGNNVIIGAGSVVTKDIPDWAIAAGNPCKSDPYDHR